MNLKNNSSEEIGFTDLTQIFNKTFQRLGYIIYRFFCFLNKYKFILISLLIFGIVAGVLLDKFGKKNIYKYELIVAPNVGSQTYLYKEINSLKSDSILISAKIEPIVDVFNLMTESPDNLKVGEFLADNNVKIVKHTEGNETEQVYKYHIIKFLVKDSIIGKKRIHQLIDKLNNEPYFKEKLAINHQYLTNKMKENEVSIDNINNLFSKLGNNEAKSSSANVNIEVFTEINKLIENKQYLIDEIKKLKTELLENKSTIYKIAEITDDGKANKTNYKFILPIVLIVLFTFYLFVRNLTQKYGNKK